MGKETEDKAERVLSIYSRLKQGHIVFKAEESIRYDVSSRTIQRDISDVQSFLRNQCSETGEVQEIVYDRKSGGYRLETKYQSRLEPKELLAACKVLLESRSLVKDELFPIIRKMLKLCVDTSEEKELEKLIRNEMYHYVELKHGKKLLECLWKLEQAVQHQYYIEITYKRLKDNEMVIRKVKPVGIMFSEFYFYLTAFIENIDKQEHFVNPDDISPTIYRVDRLESVCVTEEHFTVTYANRFEEGEFRKRVQFMYGGQLRRVKLKCKARSLEAVLDRLPTAEVTGRDGEDYIVRAEVFGDGIDMWLKGQGDNVLHI